MNFALLSAVAAQRLSNGDNQLIEDMSRKVRSRSAMRVEKELKAAVVRWGLGEWSREWLENWAKYWETMNVMGHTGRRYRYTGKEHS